MKKILSIALFLVLAIQGYSQEKKGNKQSKEIEVKFTILENSGPSLVYQIDSDKQAEVEVQIRNIDDKLISSEKNSINGNFISKINVFEVMSSEFNIILYNDNKEIYREKITQTNK